MHKIGVLLFGLLLLCSCDRPSIVGEWIQPIPGMENQLQGIKIDEGGVASSINMHTLLYKSWRQNGDHVVLGGESIGNGQTIEFQEKYEIDRLSDRKLILKNGDVEMEFRRKNS